MNISYVICALYRKLSDWLDSTDVDVVNIKIYYYRSAERKI